MNATALKNLFKLFVSFLKDADLIGCETIAVDGTKIRGNNSKKNNYNQKKIYRHLAYIEEKSAGILKEFEEADKNDTAQEKLSHLQEKLDRLQNHKIKYEQLQSQLDASDEPQVSTTDPDARALLVRGVVVEAVSYTHLTLPTNREV